MDLHNHPISHWVPHAGAMCLLDRALTADEQSLTAEVTIRAEGLFGSAEGVGGWVGIEYMAQAVAAWAGWHARQNGQAPRVGYLLGTRRYDCRRPRFAVGETLTITVRCAFRADNGLGQFDCSINSGDDTIATAALTVFEPEGGKHD